MAPHLLHTVILAFALCACPHVDRGAKLTDADVTKYVAAYRALRTAGPGLAEQARKGEGQPGNAAVESAVKKAGFASYPEFVKVNARVAWAFSHAQGTAAVKGTGAAVSDAEKQIDTQLANPQVPEAAKVELRKAKQQIRDQYATNKEWADVALTVSDQLADKDDVAVVMRHRAELEAAFQGR